MSRGLVSCAMVAGETSGDLLAAHLLQAMMARWPALQAYGIGGPAMTSQGFEAWWPSERLAVRGYVEVLPRLAELLRMRRRLGDRLLARRPQVFVGVDAPDFNFDLELRLRGAGLRTVHFVSPSFWAWRAEKLAKLRQAADLVLCIFPFEADLLARQGIAARYVGHPLASVIPITIDRAAARRGLGLEQDAQVVALMPGSRASEIEHLCARFLAAAALILRSRSGVSFVLPAVPALAARIAQEIRRADLGQQVRLLQGHSHQALAACDAVLVASGTATLEAALFKRPMVIAYHMHWLSWRIMQRKRLQPWVGLPNILRGRFVVPELLQEQATPEALARGVLSWLEQPQQVLELQRDFEALHLELRRDTATLAVDAIEELCARDVS